MILPTVKLARNADELLRDFPLTEPDFEAQAKAIEVRLKGSPGGVVFDDLLRAPELAAEPGEAAATSSVRAGSAPKSNFAEMARKSVKKKDDGSAHQELLAATAQSRRPNAEMVERVRAAGRSSAAASSTPLLHAEAPAERNSGVVVRAETAAAVAPRAPVQAPNRGTLIGIAGVAVALAACVALYVKSNDSQSPTTAALAAEKASDVPGAGARNATPALVVAAKPDEGVVSPEALGAAPPEAGKTVETKSGAPKALGGGSAPAGALAIKSAPPVGAGAKQEAVVLEDDPEPPKAAPVEHKAEPAREPQLKPAEGNAGSVPLSPSGGAVSTALSSVRSGAQACLAGQTEPVTATVTFSSDGHVLRVNASGPSGACIQAALSKAHIAPFAKDSFSATTTVRPP